MAVRGSASPSGSPSTEGGADQSGTEGGAEQSVSRPPPGKVGRKVILASAITALGGLLFGYDTGVISGALLYIGKSFPMTSTEKEILTSLLLIGALIGAMFAGRIADRIGRRPTLLLTAVVFVVGVLGAASSPSYGFLLAMRVVIGLAVGSASMVAPMFIAEIAPPRLRGGLVSLNQLAVTVGILTAFLVDYGLASTGNWRLMFGLAAIPAAALFVGVFLQHESPQYLINQGRIDEARSVLSEVRTTEDIDAEIKGIQEVRREKASARDLLERSIRPALILGVLLAVFQQVTGINTVIYYAPSLLKNAGLGNNAALLANVAVGVVNVAMTVLAIRLLDRTGRRPLLLVGTAGMAVSLVVVALTFVGGSQLSGGVAIVAVVGLMAYTGFFAVGLGPVFWLLISEIYPLRIRGQAMSVATAANWGANFVVTISFLTLLDVLKDLGTFLLFAALTVVALAYFYKNVPETKGRTLHEIELDLEGRPASVGS
jgi:SP family galactose:H+ symporter-like MFS transporter